MQRITIPTTIAQHPAIQPAVDGYNALVAEQVQAKNDVGHAKHGLPQAREADKQAWATALAADTHAKDPGQKETEKAQRAIEQAERRLAALTSAVADAEAPVHTAVSTHHGDLMATLGQAITGSQHALGDALDALDTSLHAWTMAKGTAAWLRDFPNGGRVPTGAGYVPALAPRQRNTGQTAASVDDVLAGLRELLNPPEKRGTPVAVGGSNAVFLGVAE